MLFLPPKYSLSRTRSRKRRDQARSTEDRKNKKFSRPPEPNTIKRSIRIILVLQKIHQGLFKNSKANVNFIKEG